LVIIGGGVAGYVAAIKAGQEGMKVRDPYFFFLPLLQTAVANPYRRGRLLASRSEVLLAGHA
jgi:hypothetical protein